MFLTEEDKQGKSQANDERHLFLVTLTAAFITFFCF